MGGTACTWVHTAQARLLGIGGELSEAAAQLGGAAPGHRLTLPRPEFRDGLGSAALLPLSRSGSPGAGWGAKGTACGRWGFGLGSPDVGHWTLRSGVELAQEAWRWREDGRVGEAFVWAGKGRPRVGRFV